MNKRTMIIVGCSFIGVLVLLLVIVWMMSNFRTTYYSYEKVEDKIVEASKKYYSDHPELLPTIDGKYSLDYNVLVNGNYISPLTEILKDGASCTADILVNKSGVDYDYIPRLNCENYSAVELYKQILNDNPVVVSGSGLYRETDGSYYFRGKVTNNYFAMGSNDTDKSKELLWQIIGINNDNTVRIRALSKLENYTVFDNRYNINRDYNSGYNYFEDSVYKDYLNKLQTEATFLTASQKSKLVAKKLCIGSRSDTETIKNGSVECSVMSKDNYLFGTLYPYEFLRASLDENCKTITDKSCENLNYLAHNSSSEWSTTPSSDDTYRVYSYYGTYYSLSTASNEKSMYVVANLNEFSFYKSGTGTQEDPYRIFKVTKSTN